MFNSQIQEKTILSKSFCFYYRVLNDKQSNSGHIDRYQYQNYVKKIGSFNSIEDFWSIFQHLKKPDSCQPGIAYYLFNEDIKPLWEDENNVKGGRISLKMKKKSTSLLWEEIVIAFIGDVFPLEVSIEISGIIVSMKDNFNIIQFWIKDFSKKDTVALIKDTIMKLFEIPKGVKIKIDRFNSKTKLEKFTYIKIHNKYYNY